MKYMLLTYLDEKAWHAMSAEEQQKAMNECAPHVERLMKSGKAFDGAPLEPTWKATTVKRRGGQLLVTDGPYAETREQLGGYALFEAKDHAEAVEIAKGFIGTSAIEESHTIEVRPVVEYKLPEK